MILCKTIIKGIIDNNKPSSLTDDNVSFSSLLNLSKVKTIKLLSTFGLSDEQEIILNYGLNFLGEYQGIIPFDRNADGIKSSYSNALFSRATLYENELSHDYE